MKSDQVHETVIKYCAEGESGRQFNAFLIGDEIPGELPEAVNTITEYIDSVFEKCGCMPTQQFNGLLSGIERNKP